ncbi:MAG: flagellin [Paracoccaceae bacterium]
MITRVGTGDQVLSTLLSRSSANLRAEVMQRGQEVATGQHADLAAAVGGDFSALAAIDHSLARLRGYAANTSEAGLFTDVMQSALQVVSDAATDLGGNVLRGVGLATETGISTLATEASRHFTTAVGALNTRFSERAVFSGVNAEVAPLPDADSILSALETVTAGLVTTADVKAAIDGWFTDPLGFGAMYAGGAGRAEVPIAQGETADLSVTALDPAIRDTLKGIASVALLGRGLLAGDLTARTDLAKSAGEALMTAGESRAQLMARVGTEQARISAAETRNTAEKSALDIARAGIVSADPYDAATRLQDLQTRLESLYLVTARLSRLTLTEFLR